MIRVFLFIALFLLAREGAIHLMSLLGNPQEYIADYVLDKFGALPATDHDDVVEPLVTQDDVVDQIQTDN